MKIYKPTTSGRRGSTGVDFKVLSKKRPLKKLTRGHSVSAGRNSSGRITVWGKGGGHKKRLRMIDFKQNASDVPARVISIEYDPNRSCFIALIVFDNGEKKYIIAPNNLKEGDKLLFSEKAPLSIGNRLPLKNIPVGTVVHNIEIFPGKGGQLVRSAGSGAEIMSCEGGYVQLRMPSKEIRIVSEDSMASIGQVSNPEHSIITIGKAGRNRWRGIKPSVRGSAMNPVDHPHGGGEGRSSIGLKKPKTPWGKPAMGVKTRKNKRSDRFIIKRRKK